MHSNFKCKICYVLNVFFLSFDQVSNAVYFIYCHDFLTNWHFHVANMISSQQIKSRKYDMDGYCRYFWYDGYYRYG